MVLRLPQVGVGDESFHIALLAPESHVLALQDKENSYEVQLDNFNWQTSLPIDVPLLIHCSNKQLELLLKL